MYTNERQEPKLAVSTTEEMKKSQNIHIGHCTSPHGIRGEFLFVFYNHDSRVVQKNSPIFISPSTPASSLKNELRKILVSNIRYGNKVIAELEGITSRNQVEEMIPFNIYLPRENLPQLEENEVYLNDLLGCRVLNFKTKEQVGVVENFYENGQQVILQVKTAKEKIEILFIDNFVPVVNVEDGFIEVNLPEIIE